MTNRQPDVFVADLVLVKISDSGKAWLCRHSDDLMEENTFWLPVSQILSSDMCDADDEGFVEIPHWLAKDKDLL